MSDVVGRPRLTEPGASGGDRWAVAAAGAGSGSLEWFRGPVAASRLPAVREGGMSAGHWKMLPGHPDSLHGLRQ